MSAACWFEGTRGSPSAPKRMASNSSRSISMAPTGRLTPSRRNLSAPQSNSMNSMGRLPDLATARSTFTASGVTSLPMPSPGITAIRAAVPPFRKGMPGKVLPPRRLDFLPSGQLCGMKRPSTLRLRCRRHAILPSKPSSRHLIDVTFLRERLRETCCDSTNLVRKGNIPKLTESNNMEKPKEAKNGFLLLGALLIAATALFVFGWLADEMLEGDTQKFDEFVRDAVHRHAAPGLTWLMQGFSFLGSVTVVTTLCILAIATFLYFRQARMAALLATTMIGMAALDVAL